MNDTPQHDSSKTMAYMPPGEATVASVVRNADPERHVNTVPSEKDALPPSSAAPPGYEFIEVLGHAVGLDREFVAGECDRHFGDLFGRRGLAAHFVGHELPSSLDLFEIAFERLFLIGR